MGGMQYHAKIKGMEASFEDVEAAWELNRVGSAAYVSKLTQEGTEDNKLGRIRYLRDILYHQNLHLAELKALRDNIVTDNTEEQLKLKTELATVVNEAVDDLVYLYATPAEKKADQGADEEVDYGP